MNPIIFKIVKEYNKPKIERKYNNSFIISAWITQDQLKKQFQYIEKETDNFDYFDRQKKLTSLLKLLVTLTLFFAVIFGFNSTKDVMIIVLSILIILIIVTCIFKFIFWNGEYIDFIIEITEATKTVNNSFFNLKGLELIFNKSDYSFLLDYKKTDDNEDETSSLIDKKNN